MSDLKVVSKSFDKSGPIGKVIIGFCVFAGLFLSVFVWATIQNTTVLNEMVRQNNNIEVMINNQVKLDVFKRCIKNAYDQANEFYNDEVLTSFGKILMEFNIPFPDELNTVLIKYRKKISFINDCLIFPEDL